MYKKPPRGNEPAFPVFDCRTGTMSEALRCQESVKVRHSIHVAQIWEVTAEIFFAFLEIRKVESEDKGSRGILRATTITMS
jgi:hypothetical protein